MARLAHARGVKICMKQEERLHNKKQLHYTAYTLKQHCMHLLCILFVFDFENEVPLINLNLY